MGLVEEGRAVPTAPQDQVAVPSPFGLVLVLASCCIAFWLAERVRGYECLPGCQAPFLQPSDTGPPLMLHAQPPAQVGIS